MLQDVLTVVGESAVILLDAHYTGGREDVRGADGDTPIAIELDHVFGGPQHDHIVMIDDARLFGSDPAYPALDYVEERARNAGYTFRVEEDIIHLTPGATS